VNEDRPHDRDADESEGQTDGADYEYEYPDKLLESGRERGLSKTDRRFLVTGKTRGGEQPAEEVRINTRNRIRKRIRESIVDFWLISVYLDDRDRGLIFDQSGDPMDDWELREGIKNAMQFFYMGLQDSNLMDFETGVTSAVHDAERDRHEGPVIIETEFDVDVDEQFDVQEAYDKFQKGAPLEPAEVGALLVTGHVQDPTEVQHLAQHARVNGLIESSVSPLLAKQMADVLGGKATERTFSSLAHLPPSQLDDHFETSAPTVRSEDVLDWGPAERDTRYASVDDLVDDDASRETDTDVSEDGSETESGAKDSKENDSESGDEEPAADR